MAASPIPLPSCGEYTCAGEVARVHKVNAEAAARRAAMRPTAIAQGQPHEHASRPARHCSPQAGSAPAAAAKRSRISPRRTTHWSCMHRAAEPTPRSSHAPHQKHIPATECTCRRHRCAACNRRPLSEAGTPTAAGRNRFCLPPCGTGSRCVASQSGTSWKLGHGGKMRTRGKCLPPLSGAPIHAQVCCRPT